MSTPTVEVDVAAEQAVAFRRLHAHLVDSGALAAAAESTVDEPRTLSYRIRLRDGTSQVTTLELRPTPDGCRLAMSVALEHDAVRKDSAWLTPEQLGPQHKVLANAFAGIASGAI